MEQINLSWEPPERSVFSVADLTARIRGLLWNEIGLVWVGGEISGTKVYPSGHIYFTLKDERAQVRCVCFKTNARLLRCKPQDGMAVVARGRIDVFEARGEYQLQVESLEPQGAGALQMAFEQLKKKLAAEGLFETSRKRALPRYPVRIGIVTSPTGAVIRDMVQVLGRRFPGLGIRLYPAQVQGPGSIEAVVEGLDYFSRSGWAQVVIAGRGGGSLEDLWTFNEERVARAIARCRVPVISAVGHETDFTIADFVADLRAPTPSAAAEMVICTRQQVLDQLAGVRQKLVQGMRFRLARASARLHQQGLDRATADVHRLLGRAQQRVDELEYRARERVRAALESRRRRRQALESRLRAQDLRLRLADGRRRMEAAATALAQHLDRRLSDGRSRVESLAAQLAHLSPLGVLERGYAIVQWPDGRVVRDAAETPAGSDLGVRLQRGRLGVRVTESG